MRKNKFTKKMQYVGMSFIAAILVMFGIGIFESPEFLISLATVAPLAWIVNGTFKELSNEEIAGLDAESLAGYYNELNKRKYKKLEEKIATKATKDDIDKLKEELFENQKQQVKTLNQALETQGLAIKKSMTQGNNRTLSLGEQIHKSLTDNIDVLKKLKSERVGNLSFSLKTMTISGNVTGEVPQAQREPGMNIIARRLPFIAEILGARPASSNVISWVEQQNITGGAGGTLEGSLKNEMAFDLVVASENIKKRTVFIKVSDEMLDDIDFIQSEIQRELLRDLSLDVDNQILNGDGIGQNFNGILTQATAFAAGSFALAIPTPNNWDVLRVAINQIIIANHFPTHIIMHPTDVTKMELTKDIDGNYVMPPFQAANGMVVKGLPIVENTGIAADNFLVMDRDKAGYFTKQGTQINIGLDSDDFTKNMSTIRAELRGLLRIKGNDKTAFVKGLFSTAIIALTKP